LNPADVAGFPDAFLIESDSMPTPINTPTPAAPVVPVAAAPVVAPVAAAAAPVTPAVTNPAENGNVFVMGPNVQHTEPIPAVLPTPGLRTVAFQTVATSPGAIAHLTLEPAVNATDVLPLNVYVVFATDFNEPAAAQYYLDGSAPFTVVPITVADPATGNFDVTVAGVSPSLSPYLVQVILEFIQGTVVSS